MVLSQSKTLHVCQRAGCLKGSRVILLNGNSQAQQRLTVSDNRVNAPISGLENRQTSRIENRHLPDLMYKILASTGCFQNYGWTSQHNSGTVC